MDNKILIVFKNNKIDVQNFSELKNNEIYKIWEKIIEDYNLWVSEFKDIKITKDKKKITEILKWRGMSLWWINSLCRKDTELNNQWIHRMFILYLIKELKKVKIFLEIETDDRLLIHSINKNFNLNLIKITKIFNIKSFFKNYLKLFINIKNSIYFFFQTIFKVCFLKLFKYQQKKKFINKNFIWFLTYYPLNWVDLDHNELYDRHLHKLPISDHSKENNVGYLVYLNNFFKRNLFKISFKKLKKIFKSDYVLIESHINFYDIFEVFISSYKILIKIYFLKKNLKKNFIINDIDFFEILYYELKKSFWVDNQYNMLHGIAQKNFIKDINCPQKIITYDELWTQSRVGYYLCKKLNNQLQKLSL